MNVQSTHRRPGERAMLPGRCPQRPVWRRVAGSLPVFIVALFAGSAGVLWAAPRITAWWNAHPSQAALIQVLLTLVTLSAIAVLIGAGVRLAGRRWRSRGYRRALRQEWRS